MLRRGWRDRASSAIDARADEGPQIAGARPRQFKGSWCPRTCRVSTQKGTEDGVLSEPGMPKRRSMPCVRAICWWRCSALSVADLAGPRCSPWPTRAARSAVQRVKANFCRLLQRDMAERGDVMQCPTFFAMRQVTQVASGAAPRPGVDVYVDAVAKILGNVKVGDEAHVDANAVVFKDVPPGITAVGIPARIALRQYCAA